MKKNVETKVLAMELKKKLNAATDLRQDLITQSGKKNSSYIQNKILEIERDINEIKKQLDLLE